MRLQESYSEAASHSFSSASVDFGVKRVNNDTFAVVVSYYNYAESFSLLVLISTGSFWEHLFHPQSTY